jgi:hypothetical protein
MLPNKKPHAGLAGMGLQLLETTNGVYSVALEVLLSK